MYRFRLRTVLSLAWFQWTIPKGPVDRSSKSAASRTTPASVVTPSTGAPVMMMASQALALPSLAAKVIVCVPTCEVPGRKAKTPEIASSAAFAGSGVPALFYAVSGGFGALLDSAAAFVA